MKNKTILHTPEGHKAIIQKIRTPKRLLKEVFQVSIYSKEEDCIIYGVQKPTLAEAEEHIQTWREIVTIVPQPIGLRLAK